LLPLEVVIAVCAAAQELAPGYLVSGIVAGGPAGLMQINVEVPASILPNVATPVVLTIGGVSSQSSTTISIH